MHMKTMGTGVVVQDVNPSELYDVLAMGSSNDAAQASASYDRLKPMLSMNGVDVALQEIALQKAVPLHIRQQAIIQLKNHVQNNWRSRRVLSDPQRVQVRTRSLEFLFDEDETIAKSNVHIVSKIARQDYPNSWPTLIDHLMRQIESNLQMRYSAPTEDPQTTLILRRSLQHLKGVLKEFSGFKMLAGVRTMESIVNHIRDHLFAYYSTISATISGSTVTRETIGTSRVINDLTIAHLVYKCLSKVVFWLWQRVDKSGQEFSDKHGPWLQELFQSSALQLKNLLDLRHLLLTSGLTLSSQAREPIQILTRHILAFGKLFRLMSSFSHTRFVELPMCTDLVLFYWSQVDQATAGSPDRISDSTEAVYPTRLLVQGMVLFKDNLSRWSSLRRDGTPNKNTLSKEFVENATTLVISRFMRMTASDLEEWSSDPEEFLNTDDKENDQWEFEIRGCSERVLISLSNHFSAFVVPLLKTTFETFARQPVSTLEAVLQKEALYCAVGRCSLRLKDEISFDQWLQQTLAVEARSTDPHAPVLKRRIAWLLGKWVSDSCASPKQPLIWDILIYLLSNDGPGTDIAVRMAAALALRECIDTIEFDKDVFTPFLPMAVSELVKLMGQVEYLETKNRIDNALNALIGQVGERIAPCVNMITGPLPELWVSAGDKGTMFKGSLLQTMTNLVQALKSLSTPLGGLVVALVRESLKPDVKVYLDEDGMNLWAAALRNTMTAQSVDNNLGLIELFPEAMRSLATNLDLLGKTTGIIESYFFLDGALILQTCAVDLFSAFVGSLKGSAIVINLKDMLNALNLLVQITPSNLWGEPLHLSGLFAFIIESVIDPEVSTILHLEHIFLLSRIVMADRQVFLQLMSATASNRGVDEKVLYEGVLDQWWAKFDNMSEPRHRKLCAMGIACLVSTGRQEVLARLSTEIFNLWLDVFGEIKEAQQDDQVLDGFGSPIASPYNLKRHWELDEAPSSYYQDTEGTPEYERRRAVYDRDPVRTMQLSAYIAQCMNEARSHYSGNSFEELFLSSADITVMSQISAELKS